MDCGSGMELVTITSVNSPPDSRSQAGPLSSACEAQAYTARAPLACSSSAPACSVPAVSIMSSTSTAARPATSPIRFITCAALCPVRRLSMMASGASLSALANTRARETPPTSGETTTISSDGMRVST